MYVNSQLIGISFTVYVVSQPHQKHKRFLLALNLQSR